MNYIIIINITNKSIDPDSCTVDDRSDTCVDTEGNVLSVVSTVQVISLVFIFILFYYYIFISYLLSRDKKEPFR